MKREAVVKEQTPSQSVKLTEVRIHGKSGQGAITAGQLLAIAAFYDGKYAQAFPFVPTGRNNHPSVSFVRISNNPIQIRERVYHPDYEIVLDQELVQLSDAASGVKRGVIVNGKCRSKDYDYRDMNDKAMKIFGQPIVNTLLLGAFAAYTDLVTLDSLLKAVEERFKGREELIIKNKRAIREAYGLKDIE